MARRPVPPVLPAVARAGLAVVVAAAVLTGAVATTAHFAARPLDGLELGVEEIPPLEEVVSDEHSLPSRVLAADGSLVGIFRPDHTYIPVEPADIPDVVRVAVLAAEDADFERHRGFDAEAIVRAGVRNLVAGEVTQGGSTITQQLAKNLVTGDERSVERKVRELAVAIELERRYDKGELLAAYLNVAYFGDGALGIAAAARAYFGKSLGDLSLSEAALLAGLLPAPGQWSPRVDPEAAEARRGYVLDRIETLGVADPDVLAWSRAEIPQLVPRERSSPEHPFFMDYVRRFALDDLGLSQRALTRGGLTIRTTLDPALQDWARAVVAIHVPRDEDPAAAVAVVEPGSGHVRALVGGTDWERSEVNLALGDRGAGTGRQPGSAFKPFVLVAALEQGLWPETVVPAPRRFQPEGAERPMGNYDGSGHGRMPLDEAMARSVNTSYAWLTEQLGPETVADAARRLGIAVPDHPGVSLGIGAYETSPLDMAAAYAALAADGVYALPVPVVAVLERDGTPLELDLPEPRMATSPEVARTVHPVLARVIEGGTGTRAAIGRPAHGKTGTSNAHRDAWFAGYTPQLSAAVWVGHPGVALPMTSVPGVGRVTGGSIPASIWAEVMRAAHGALPVEELPAPTDDAADARAPVEQVQRIVDAWERASQDRMGDDLTG